MPTGKPGRTHFVGVCLGCGADFSVPVKSASRPAPKYCSRKCFHASGMGNMRKKAYEALATKWNSEVGHKKPRTRVCEMCGELIDVKPSKPRRFCSRSCSKRFVENGPKLCTQCGSAIQQSPSGRRKFCNNECFLKWRTGHSEIYKKPRLQKCKHCGYVIDVQPSLKRTFCSTQCSALHKQAKLTKSAMTLKWQRRYAREVYGNKCCRCGYDKIPEILQVHHRDFNPRNQNRENLLLLCPNCHEAEHFTTKTGRFGSHSRRRKKNHQETYAFKKSASVERLEAVGLGKSDPGPWNSNVTP